MFFPCFVCLFGFIWFFYHGATIELPFGDEPVWISSKHLHSKPFSCGSWRTPRTSRVGIQKIKVWRRWISFRHPVIPFELNPPNISGGSDFGCLGPRAYQKVMIFSFQPLVFRVVFLSMAGLAQAPSSGIHVGHAGREHLWRGCHWCCTQKQATRPRCSAVMGI